MRDGGSVILTVIVSGSKLKLCAGLHGGADFHIGFGFINGNGFEPHYRHLPSLDPVASANGLHYLPGEFIELLRIRRINETDCSEVVVSECFQQHIADVLGGTADREQEAVYRYLLAAVGDCRQIAKWARGIIRRQRRNSHILLYRCRRLISFAAEHHRGRNKSTNSRNRPFNF